MHKEGTEDRYYYRQSFYYPKPKEKEYAKILYTALMKKLGLREIQQVKKIELTDLSVKDRFCGEIVFDVPKVEKAEFEFTISEKCEMSEKFRSSIVMHEFKKDEITVLTGEDIISALFDCDLGCYAVIIKDEKYYPIFSAGREFSFDKWHTSKERKSLKEVLSILQEEISDKEVALSVLTKFTQIDIFKTYKELYKEIEQPIKGVQELYERQMEVEKFLKQIKTKQTCR